MENYDRPEEKELCVRRDKTHGNFKTSEGVYYLTTPALGRNERLRQAVMIEVGILVKQVWLKSRSPAERVSSDGWHLSNWDHCRHFYSGWRKVEAPGCPASCPGLSLLPLGYQENYPNMGLLWHKASCGLNTLSPGRPCRSRLDGKVMGERETNLANPQVS